MVTGDHQGPEDSSAWGVACQCSPSPEYPHAYLERGSQHPSFGLELQLANLSGGETKGQRGELPQSAGGTGFPRNYPINATNVGRGLQLPGLKARPTQARTGRDIVQWLRVCVMCGLCENLRSCLSIRPPYFSGECLRPATCRTQDQTGRSYSGLLASGF